MSYLGGFSKLRSEDDDSQGMARGENSVRSHEEEGMPLTSSKDVPSLADSTRVITWLKPVGEPRADAFWKKFSFLPSVRVPSMSSGPRVMVYTDEDCGELNFIYKLEIHISEGLRFPLIH